MFDTNCFIDSDCFQAVCLYPLIFLLRVNPSERWPVESILALAQGLLAMCSARNVRKYFGVMSMVKI